MSDKCWSVHDVCILGAGLSGLSCARKILRMRPRSSIVVLEARARVGGRTLSVPAGADSVDLGGQWVGPAQPKCLELIHELKLATVKQQWFDNGFNNFSSGSSVPLTDEEDRELKAIAAQLDGWAAESACHPHAAQWDALSVSQFFDGTVKSAVVRRELDLLVRTVTASEPHDLSFFYFLFFLGACGGVAGVGDGDGGAQSFRLPCGAQQLSLGMAEELQAQGVHPFSQRFRTGRLP
ncbi:Amine oxidase [flavin-containing] [Tetrabaena socialis]|uniref:monoamine oxidase n=1 Tax=Tetrabaena socialis TaxID=47790 RepID=A0A2J7ZHV2_9CHLO|nr:Amine oxidase [flavin-containing] [Tetrabaena socialis]|eukprot:PNG99852.1 Amine oxidase [flavin-containing] [Tetrabaena socialis]